MKLAFVTLILALLGEAAGVSAAPDLILHDAKVITVDKAFSVQQAIAIQGNQIIRVGSNEEILKLRGDRTEVVKLHGLTILPGLMDSHTHPLSAAMTEADHPIGDMQSISDVLDYFRARSTVSKPGEWII